MKFFSIVSFFSFLAMVLALGKQDGDAQTTTTSTTSATSVYVTITSNGKLTVVQSAYSQSFMSTYTTTGDSSVQSGDIGMGSLSGSVGGIKSYAQTTPGQSNAAVGLFKVENLYAGVFGVVFLLIGGLL